MNEREASVPASADGHPARRWNYGRRQAGSLSAEVRAGLANGWKPNFRSRSPTLGVPLSNLISSLRFHHFQQALSGILDIGIAILMGAALHRQQCTTMDVFEIAEWKFESRLAVLNMRRVDPEMPL